MVLPTLLLVDIQRAFDHPGWGERNNPDMESAAARLLAGWRKRGAPVIHVRHESASPDGLFVRDTAAFDYKPGVEPRAGEPEIVKNVNSSFIGTDLEARLRANGAHTVVIAGLTTDHCCSTTARMAANLGFETWMVEDALATFDRKAPDGPIIPAETVHRTELAILDGEFAEVVDVAGALERLG